MTKVLLESLVRAISRKRFAPDLSALRHMPLIRLGSQYGGWSFVPSESLFGSTVLSCGLGEDASFDIEFANKYSSTIYLVDPTPRAVNHFNSIIENIGHKKNEPYSLTGNQRVDSYELTKINPDQLHLVPFALSNEVGTAKFYLPRNPTDVSHSLINFQNNYSDSSPNIEVETLDFKTLFSDHVSGQISLAKFDIEGAEIQVVPDMLRSNFKPQQVLIEYDELNFPSRRSTENFTFVHELLIEKGYVPVFFDKRSCVSYFLEDY